MRVSFSLGSKKSPAIINTLSKNMDNVEFMSYDSIQEMVDESASRRIFFDRIVFSKKIIQNVETDFRVLREYISEYSENTSVVFLYEEGDVESASLFDNYFNSPLHTSALASKITIKVLEELVGEDIKVVREKYGNVNTSLNTKMVTSKQAGEDSNANKVQKPEKSKGKKEKKGFLSGLFGGKKNSSEKVESENSNESSVPDVGNATVSAVNNAVENVASTFVGSGANVAVSGMKQVHGDFGYKGDSSGYEFSSVYGEESNFGDEISPENDEFDFLGIGDFGEQHVDTGFLDEDVESELEKELDDIESEDSGNQEISSGGDSIDDQEQYQDEDYNDGGYDDEDVHDEMPNYGFEDSSSLGDISEWYTTGVNIIISERNSGVLSRFIDESVNLVSSGKRVLFVDCDNISNGVLSFIDIGCFYSNILTKGTSVYSEDGVDILSAGYGCKETFNGETVNSLARRYDYIFVDCPLDCINSLDKGLFTGNMKVFLNGNLSSMMYTVHYLTSLNNLVERKVYDLSDFVYLSKSEYFNEELDIMQTISLFSNVNWLNKLS